MEKDQKVKDERKEKREKIIDRIIKIVLIIIIILLLLHNCELIRRGKLLNGNGDVIEIKCDSNGQCDDKDKDNPKTGDNGTGGKYGTAINGKQSGGSSSSQGTTPSKKDDDDDDDDDEEFTVFDKKITWGSESVLDIFEKPIYGYNKKIAPGDHNAYKFTVKNMTKYNLKYDMTFTEVGNDNMEMRYKLKKNGSYVVSNYVTYDQLDLSSQLINSKSSDVYLLEWKWLGDNSDSTAKDNKDKAAAGVATYKIKINIEAESING